MDKGIRVNHRELESIGQRFQSLEDGFWYIDRREGKDVQPLQTLTQTLLISGRYSEQYAPRIDGRDIKTVGQ